MKTKSTFILILLIGIIALHGCVTTPPTNDLTAWAEQQEAAYVEIRNAAAVDYRAGKLPIGAYNKIRAACCDYTTASNAAYEQYAVVKNSELLQVQGNKAMAELKAKVQEIRGGVK